MNRSLLLASLALFLPSLALAAESSRTIEMIAVAERFAHADKIAPPSPAQPVRYVAVAAGYWEAGDPYAGEKPPADTTIAAELEHALASQGFQPVPAEDARAPDLLLTYHWGVLAPPRLVVSSPVGLDRQLVARLALVAPLKTALEVERDAIAITTTATPINYIEIHGNRLTWDRAQDGRFFAIVTAYDYAAFARGETDPLWRVKLSSHINGGSARDIIPALLRASGPYFGRAFGQAQAVGVPLPSRETTTASADESVLAPVPAPLQALTAGAINQLLRREYAQFSGEPLAHAPTLYTRNQADSTPPTPAPIAKARPTFPAEIYSRVTPAGADLAGPQPGQPLRYVAYDAGFAALGQPLAGTAAPSPALIADTLHDALASRDYEVATGENAPAIALVYHWGYVRVAKPRSATPLPSSSTDAFVTPFVIVSAYDFADLTHNEQTLLWRVGLSADHENLEEALPALVENAATYFGRDLSKRRRLTLPAFARAATGAAEPDASPAVPANAGAADRAVHTLIEQERTRLVWKFDLPVTPQDYVAHVAIAPAAGSRAAAPLPLSDWRPAANGRQLDIVGYAAQTYRGSLLARPTPQQPVYYVARDAGEVQSGVAVHETAPKPEAAAQALASGLAAQGYLAADAQHRPSLLLLYRWGSRHLTTGPSGEPGGDGLWSENTFALSAYDYGDFARGEKTLVWRTLLRAPQTDLRSDLPALVLGGARWFGRSFEQPQEARVPVLALDSGAPVTDSPFALAPELSQPFATPLFRELLDWEHDGRYAQVVADRPAATVTAAPASMIAGRTALRLIHPSEDQSAGLPPELARRIAAYLKEKSSVQDAIAAKVRAQPAGADPAQTVDEFTRANAARIAGLVRERDAIRTELSRFLSQRGTASGNAALDAILRAFAADVQQLNGAPRHDG